MHWTAAKPSNKIISAEFEFECDWSMNHILAYRNKWGVVVPLLQFLSVLSISFLLLLYLFIHLLLLIRFRLQHMY